MSEKVKVWPKDGEPEVLSANIERTHGRTFLRQWFINPYDQSRTDFTLFGIKKKNDWPSIVLPVTHDLNVLAIKQFRPGANEIVLEIPGGNPDPEENDNSAIAVAERELTEETGYKAEIMTQLSPYGIFEPVSYTIDYYPCLALNCRKVKEPNLDPNEHVELIQYSLEEWLEMAFAGSIKDNKSLSVTMMALPYILGIDAKTLAKLIMLSMRNK